MTIKISGFLIAKDTTTSPTDIPKSPTPIHARDLKNFSFVQNIFSLLSIFSPFFFLKNYSGDRSCTCFLNLMRVLRSDLPTASLIISTFYHKDFSLSSAKYYQRLSDYYHKSKLLSYSSVVFHICWSF